MNTHKATLCVGIPTLEQVGKFGFGFSDLLGFFETCALLQSKLAGIWEIKHTGDALKVSTNACWNVTVEVLQIDLSKKKLRDIYKLRLHYQHVENNQSNTAIDQPAISFDVTGYPAGYPTKLLIGAKKVDDKFEITYTFSR